MAKQRQSGIVGAARRVSDVQGKFQNLGDRFFTGYEKSLETKRKKEEDSEGDSEEVMKRKLETEIEENEHIPKEEKEEALKCARVEEDYQIERHGFVEGGHDIDISDLRVRLTAPHALNLILKAKMGTM